MIMQEKTANATRVITSRHYTPKEERKSHVENWKKSGLTMSEYCRQNNIPIASLSEWKRAQMQDHPKFKSVQLLKSEKSQPEAATKSNNMIEIMIDQRIQIRLPQISDTSLLINIIKGLMACS
jgi:transposase-like protein